MYIPLMLADECRLQPHHHQPHQEASHPDQCEHDALQCSEFPQIPGPC